jgi:cytochrome c biogenesis protein CcmG, thiol:disulfide interchange protein DsbE
VSGKAMASVAAVAVVIGLLAYGLLSKGGQTIAVGDPVPDKQLSQLEGGGSGRIADYRGRWVLVNFWASWCGPCRSEAPALESFQRANPRDFTVLGINLYDSTDKAISFVHRYGLTYPQLHESGGDDRKEAYGMTGFPENFLINPQGHIALIRRGPVDSAYLDQMVEPLIRPRS